MELLAGSDSVRGLVFDLNDKIKTLNSVQTGKLFEKSLSKNFILKLRAYVVLREDMFKSSYLDNRKSYA